LLRPDRANGARSYWCPGDFVHGDGLDFGPGLGVEEAQLTEIGRLLEAQRIRPVIDKVFPFEQAKEALEYLAQGRSRGKVVVKL
jgi:NADPH:quinone reductase-like Zn-dependent oxidoreductase